MSSKCSSGEPPDRRADSCRCDIIERMLARRLARFVVLAIMLNAGLDFCLCDLLDGAFPAGPAKALLLQKDAGSPEHSPCCCSHAGACLCCSLALKPAVPVIGLDPGIPDAAFRAATAMPTTAPTSIEHPPRV
jgi:hypothetical protein